MGGSMDILRVCKNPNCWKRRSRIRQILIVVCCILPIIAPGTQEATINFSAVEEECTTEVCKRSADALKASINNSIDPCEDFYSYVCSGWKDSNPIPPGRNMHGIRSIIEDNIFNDLKNALSKIDFQKEDARTKAKVFYESCVNTKTRESEGVKDLRDVLDNLGGWPLLGTPLKQDYDWIDALAYCITELSINPIMAVYVGVDFENKTRHIIEIATEGTRTKLKELVSKIESSERNDEVAAYKKSIKKSAELLGSTKPEHELEADIDSMVEFSWLLAENSSPPEDHNMQWKTTVSELQQSFLDEKLDVLSLLRKVFSNITDVTDDTDILVTELPYLQEISKLLSKASPEDIANYIGWSVVHKYNYALTKEFGEANLEYTKVSLGVEGSKPIDEECIENTNEFLSFSTGNIFINNGFDPNTKTEIEDMITKIKETFRDRFRENTWMSGESRELAEHKLNKMISMVAFPSWINDTDQLNDYYKELGDMKEDSFFENLMTVLKFKTRKELRKINEQHYRTEDLEPLPTMFNAVNSQSTNTLTFYAGILQPPFYQVGLPPALNFGAIGITIAHEITHGFDKQGIERDAEGDLGDWWSPEDRQRFTNKSQCFVEQYGKRIEPATGMALNGERTIGENIADNGGIRLAFQAYKSHASRTGQSIKLPDLNLTSDQLFFVAHSYASCVNERVEYTEHILQHDTHCPYLFRVQMACSNFEEFSKAFKCPAGSPMNPENKCVLW